MALSSSSLCKIGQCLNETCHKLIYSRKTGFIAVCELKQEDKQLL